MSFLKHYHEKNSKHNTKADLSDDEDVIAFLDGQQRMTSYIYGFNRNPCKEIALLQLG